MNIAKPICKVLGIPCEFATALGYCPEKHGCGRWPKKEEE